VALSEACSNFLRRLRADRSFEVLINIGDTELTVHILDSDAGYPDSASWRTGRRSSSRTITAWR